MQDQNKFEVDWDEMGVKYQQQVSIKEAIEQEEIKIMDRKEPFKFYTGGGNGANMVGDKFLESRPWWQKYQVENIRAVEFMWTRLRNRTVHDAMLSKTYDPNQLTNNSTIEVFR